MLKFIISFCLVFVLGLNLGCNVSESKSRGYYPNAGIRYSTRDAYTSVRGRVVHVSDGDTVIVQKNNGEKLKIRMYGIDAPEKAMPYGPQSTGILKNLIANQVVEVRVFNKDRYGRSVAKIFCDRQDINAEMIRLGAAWHYKAYDKSSDYMSYDQLERNARAARRGLWNRNNPQPPWVYRKIQREQSRR